MKPISDKDRPLLETALACLIAVIFLWALNLVTWNEQIAEQWTYKAGYISPMSLPTEMPPPKCKNVVHPEFSNCRL